MFAYGKNIFIRLLMLFRALTTLNIVAASVILTQWRTKIRRQMNERDVVSIYKFLFIFHE
jgi:ABC-type transport system involved in Fe-S cluster assembly fused permease/ATPase subunit